MARLKGEKRRTPSSRAWLERQISDPYVARAKREGFRSRAAYKLAEIDDKYRLLRPGAHVVDLGAAPGGWSEIAARRIGAHGRVIAIDILEMKPVAGVEFLQLDFLDETAPGRLKAMLDGKGRRRPLRHGGQRHRPSADRPSAHHGACRGGGPFRARGPVGRRELPVQGAARGNRSGAARRAQAGLRQREACQATGEPQRFGGALSARPRLSRRCISATT